MKKQLRTLKKYEKKLMMERIKALHFDDSIKREENENNYLRQASNALENEYYNVV